MSRKKLGKYEIIDRIGRGGMAEVYRGYHAALDRYVAIKLLHPFLADDPEFKDRFENEARNVAKLRHPNIVQVYDFEYDSEGESYYMVMEMINGPTLKDRLFDLGSHNQRLATADAIRVVRAAADALAYAHQRNMIHRDVKPANLMLDEDGRVVLTDFGIAKIVTGAQFTASGGMVGTPAYMAPEQGLGESGDERSDIYSLGVILFQLATGRLPFDGETPLSIILKHVNDPLPAPSQFAPTIARDLEEIICKVLEKEAEDRYQTATEFARDLSILDEAGRRRAGADALLNAPPSPFDTRPLAPAARPVPLIAPEVDATPTVPPPVIPPHGAPPRTSGAPGRLRPAGLVGLATSVVVFVVVALLLFGSDPTPFAGFFGPDDTDTPGPTLTALAAVSPSVSPSDEPPTRQPVPSSTATRPAELTATRTSHPTEPTETPTSTATITPTVSRTPTFTRTPTRTRTPTLTRTPTTTSTPQPTFTPTPNLTGTALANFYATQAAASPTPNMTQTLTACKFEYIVVSPERYNVPPSASDVIDPRLIPANTDFSLEIVFQNTGTCAWPSGALLTYNRELTENPDDTVNLAPLIEACGDDLRPGLNFARQEQSNFYLTSRVGITAVSRPIVFSGTAPNVFGCYYGVWDLFYPNSDILVGRPLVLTIRVWGGG